MRKDKYQVELRVVNGGIERIHRAKRYEEQSALSGRSQESLDLSRAESMVALDKHKHRQASTILVPAKLHSSAPRLLAGDPDDDVYTGDPELSAASAHIESRFSRLTEHVNRAARVRGHGLGCKVIADARRSKDWGAGSLLIRA